MKNNLAESLYINVDKLKRQRRIKAKSKAKMYADRKRKVDQSV